MLFFNNINCTHRGAVIVRGIPAGLDNDDHDYHSGDSRDVVSAPARTRRLGAIPEQRE